MRSTGVQVSWRPIARDDATEWARLLAAAEAVDGTGEHYDADDLLEELSDPGLDAERDTVAAFADGAMVAYGAVHQAGAVRDVHQLHCDGCVHPDYRRRGLGRAVLERVVRRATEVHEQRHPNVPGELRVRTYDGNEGAAALLTGYGMRPVRWFYDMRRDLAEPPPAAPQPDGLRLVGYDTALDDAVRAAHNEAFVDHWGSAERDEASWRQWFTGSRAFRPELSLLALDGDEIAGYLLSYVYEAECAANGVREAWTGQLGTRRPWRGRGVATALLTAALAAYAEAGFERAALGVDTDSPTGALDLYRRTGFAPSARWSTYVRPL